MRYPTKLTTFSISFSRPTTPQTGEQIHARNTTGHYDLIIPVVVVEDKLSRMMQGKVPWPDTIHSWILRDLTPYISHQVTANFNVSLEDCHLPNAWKEVYITPLPMKRPPKQFAKDIRPISLTSHIEKHFEKSLSSAFEGQPMT